MMKCYDCMEEGKDTEAVAVCIVCGKGLCMDHSKELPLPVSVGNPPNVKHLHNSLPRIMCNYCLSNTIEDGFD
ncbi:zinc finger protein [Methanococcoides methylutens]|uniref:Zinc finger protein n=1 Tax=Methanococcoides methylutens TaxID=2226 RepID=A0A099T2W4_METMT|nr:DUF2180 family protein [Methanococcoides methylutens]KGK99457.1 zinc finger protein [Methanococcoides methylutens]